MATTLLLVEHTTFKLQTRQWFEQLCINYASETLQQKFNQKVFENVRISTYKTEGISPDEVKIEDISKAAPVS